MSFSPLIRAGPEFTKVDKETEVAIPWQTYVIMSGVLCIVDAGYWLTGWLLWYKGRLASISFWWWLRREWWDWMLRGWPWVAITVIGCWIGPSAVLYLYRLAIEQVVKQTPQYTPFDSAEGMWHPLRRREEEWIEDELEPAQPPSRTVQVEFTNGKQIQRPIFPDTNEARAFYRAVHRGESFSGRTAERFGVSRDVFNERIRDLFLELGWAEWVDRRHPRQGVRLKGQGKANIRGLTDPPPLPRRVRD